MATTWLRRAMLLVLVWPLLALVGAMLGWPTLTAILTVLPVGAAAIWAVTKIDPVLAAQVAGDERVQRSWEYLRKIIFAELVIGAYLTFVPVKNDPLLIAQLVLVVLILIFSGRTGFLTKIIPPIAGVAFLILTFLFFVGGREKARRLGQETLGDLKGEATRVTEALATANRAPSAPTASPRAASASINVLQEAHKQLPGLLKRIYAALDSGDPTTLRNYLSERILQNKRELDQICRPFTYRSHYIEHITERPGQRLEVTVRTLFKPVEEHAFTMTFVWASAWFVLETVETSDRRSAFGIDYDEAARLRPDLEAAEGVTRKFLYAVMADNSEVPARLVPASLDLPAFWESEPGRQLRSAGQISSLRSALRSDRGLKAEVSFATTLKSGGICGPRGRFLVEPRHDAPKIVAMSWQRGCHGGNLSEWEDPDLEVATLARFNLSLSQASASR